jgi:hypothetical protein
MPAFFCFGGDWQASNGQGSEAATCEKFSSVHGTGIFSNIVFLG